MNPDLTILLAASSHTIFGVCSVFSVISVVSFPTPASFRLPVTVHRVVENLWENSSGLLERFWATTLGMEPSITEKQLASFPPEAQSIIRALLAENAALRAELEELRRQVKGV